MTPEPSSPTASGHSPKHCPRAGRRTGVARGLRRWTLVWALTGLASLLWYLLRVIPKPSRAAYPCQRAAAPVAGGFVLWLLAVLGSRMVWQRARGLACQSRWMAAAVCGCLAIAGAAWALSQIPLPRLLAEPAPHGPIGTAKGIHPGRVVWVHAPDATDWSGYASPTPWWLDQHTDLSVAEEMTSDAIRSLAGEEEDAAAWDAIFRYFNREHGLGDTTYLAGEKVVIKINLTTCNARGNMTDAQYNKNSTADGGQWQNTIDNSPQMLVALLRQLVYVAGVPQADISIGDATGLFANHIYQPIHSEFPEVTCFDNEGKPGSGRVRTGFSNQTFNWSSSNAEGKLQDYLPVPFAEAKYLINYALLKGHSVGVTLCGKNNYGSLLRCPDGLLRRDEGYPGYFNIHNDMPGFAGADGMGKYRPVVDLMGHRELGGKTLLYLVDGLFGGYAWESRPVKWSMPPFGQGRLGDWPNSLFASLDPVAIDSVCFDFLLEEWPHVVLNPHPEGAAQDYLHEAALADAPDSGIFYDPEHDGIRMASLGVHEHWNNAAEKQYSRNLGLNGGIELMARTVSRPEPRVQMTRETGAARIAWRQSIGYQLQVSPDLGNQADWQPVESEPEYRDGFNVVTQAWEETARYYRLVE